MRALTDSPFAPCGSILKCDIAAMDELAKLNPGKTLAENLYEAFKAGLGLLDQVVDSRKLLNGRVDEGDSG